MPTNPTSNPPDSYIQECHCAFCQAWRNYWAASYTIDFEEFVRSALHNGASVWRCYNDPSQSPEVEFPAVGLCRCCNIYHEDRGSTSKVCHSCKAIGPVCKCILCENYGHATVSNDDNWVNDVRFKFATGTSSENTICDVCANESRVKNVVPLFACDFCERVCVEDLEVHIDGHGWFEFNRDIRCHSINDGTVYCRNCYLTETTQCNDCSTRFINSAGCSIDNFGLVCQSCHGNYGVCEDCGRYFNANRNLDCTCVSGVIQSYDHRPRWIRHFLHKRENGKNTVFFGVELEMSVDSRTKTKGKAVRDILEIWNGLPQDFMFAKSDSTVRNGIEFVTHPFSWRHLKDNRKLWEMFFTLCKENRVCGDDGTAGTHIHISRGGLRYTRLYALLRFIYGNQFLIEKIAGRGMGDGSHMDSYASISNETHKGIIKKVGQNVDVVCDRDGERYTAVNLNNMETIELRFFAGAKDFDSFMSYMEFTRSLVEFTRKSGANIWPHQFARYVIGKPKTYPRLTKTMTNLFGKDV